MSIHRSLVAHGKLVRARNVWGRLERILYLQKEGRWKEGDSVFGLPKVKTRAKAAKKPKKAKEAAAEGALAEGTVAAAPVAAAPAAPVKPSAKAEQKEREKRKKERGGKGAR